MSKIKFYDVNISSDNGESVSMETNSTVMTFLPSELLNNKSNISCTLTIVVYNSEEMSSQSTSKTFSKQLTMYVADYFYWRMIPYLIDLFNFTLTNGMKGSQVP